MSLIAATLRWLSYTERRAVLVLSRDGYVLWARSSESALKSGAYLKTSALVVPVPDKSVAARIGTFAADARLGVDLPPGVWFRDACREMSIVSENYDFTISLIHLEAWSGRMSGADEEAEPETLDVTIRRRHGL